MQKDSKGLAGEYKKLSSKREPYLKRARAASTLTLPYLIPQDENNDGQDLYIPHQGHGAKGVKNLSSKLTLGLMPSSHPFFRLQIDEQVLIKSGLNEESFGDVETTLAALERSAMRTIEGKDTRNKLNLILKHLVVSGNVLFKYGEDSIMVYPLTKYVVKRGSQGEVLEIILRERINPDKLPAEAIAHLRLSQKYPKGSEPVDIYTHVKNEGKGIWTSIQEVEGFKLQTTFSRHTRDRCPWVAARLITIDGEDYGRSYVEEHMGDLNSLEVLTKAIQEASVAASRIIFLVRPNGTTKIKAIMDANNGDAIAGNPDDVQTLQLDKQADLAIAQQVRQEIIQSLNESFLLTGAIRRDAERVTAEEIRQITQMLEEGLGGLYSQLSQSLQQPLVKLELGYMQKAGLLPQLPKDTLKPQILTGVEALGRASELAELRLYVNDLQVLGGEEVMKEYVNFGELASRLALGRNIDTNGLIYTEEERNENREMAQQEALLMQGGQAAVQNMATQPME